MIDIPASRITGIHHLTALTTDAQRAVDFYSRVLGLRLVKQTVDLDERTSRHLIFADEDYGPGALTLVERNDAQRGQWGIGGMHHLAFETEDRDSLRQWKRWLTDWGLPVTGPYDRVYFESIYFTDPDGLILEIATRGPGWTVDEAPDTLGTEVKLPPRATMAGGRDEAAIAVDSWPAPVPIPTPEMRLKRMHHVTAIGSDAVEIERFYTDLLGLRLVKRTVNFDSPSSPHLYFGVGSGSPGTIVTSFAYPRGTMRPARPGAGLTHHFALSVPDDDALEAWRDYLHGRGTPTSGIRDRVSFRSVAFHDPDGLLLEIATETQSFTADEPSDALGRRLQLPPWLEADRDDIERNLTPLTAHDPIGRDTKE